MLWFLGEYQEVTNPIGLGCLADGLNITTFDPIITTKIRITMEKQDNDENGVGVIEWEVYGKRNPVNIASKAEASASINRPEDLGGVAALNDGVEPIASVGINPGDLVWHSWTTEGQKAYVMYTWEKPATIESTEVYYFSDGGGILLPDESVFEYWNDESQTWVEAGTVTNNYPDQYNVLEFDTPIKTTQLRITMTPVGYRTPDNHGVGIREWKVMGEAQQTSDDLNEVIVKKTNKGYSLSNGYLYLETGKYGNIDTIRIADDLYKTNYVLNPENAKAQAAGTEHQWMGELMFQTKFEGDTNWSESMTSVSSNKSTARKIELDGKKIVVTYENATETKGIKDFKLIETYELVGKQIIWSMTVINTDTARVLTFGDFGLPMPFNEYWTNRGQVYEESVVDHSFVGQDSTYIYATRPSGQGKFLLFTPDTATGAGFEYQDHWRINNGHAGSAWAQDQGGWANGLNVFYIHSDVIKSTGSSYLPNTTLTLQPGESKTYSFKFTGVENEKDMKTTLYNEGIVDAVAVPSMVFAIDMPAKFYLHTNLNIDKIESVTVKTANETGLYEGLRNSVSNKLPDPAEKGVAAYEKTVTVDGEQYHIYNLKLTALGVNHVEIKYDGGKETTLQFYAMDSIKDALELHADFVTKKTQVDAPGKIQDKVFDDWMMDTQSVRGIYSGYFGWGDDWGFTHGEYLAEKNVYQPVAEQITAVDEYLDTFIWNSLMKEHHEDYRVNDWLDEEINNTGQGVTRGYAYPHVYNTYFSMYKVADKYPDMIDYIEEKETYLLRAYNILKALYGEGIAYNWDTGLMGESTTPDIIAALQKEGYYEEAQDIIVIMEKKYDNFKAAKYPYGSEYAYDNTGEEAVYTLAKLNDNNEMMKKIDQKTRACRGVQPIWYHYGNPTTICGENWWNFQYSASLVGYAMDDWMRFQDNGMNSTELAAAERINYSAKLANLTCINSGQIDSNPNNIGTVAWTYQAELGHSGGQGTGGGKIHNGWRQMSGEADTGLFGAMRILSSDIATDPVFGLFGYGCNVTEEGEFYLVTPLDGVFTRLNLIDSKLSIELARDQYTQAKVSKDNKSIELSLKNLEKSAHVSDIKLSGLAEGSYQIKVDGEVTGSFQYSAGKIITAAVPLKGSETSTVVIELGHALDNQAPNVDAGIDKTLALSDDIRLTGTVKDDGYPNMTLTSSWSVESKPTGATVKFANPDKIITDVTVDKMGTYIFKITVDDGALKGTDTITVMVTADPKLPSILANYTFDEINLVTREVPDSSGAKNTAEAISSPKLVDGKDGKGIFFTGTYCGYVRLPDSLTKRVADATISADISLAALQGNGARIFQFGDTEGKGFYLSVMGGNELVLGVTDEEKNVITEHKTGIKLGINHWKNVTLTLADHKIVLYVDGLPVYTADSNFTLSQLGKVQANYLGRSEIKSDPFLHGIIDNFTIKSFAMSASEIKEAYGTNVTGTPVSSEGGSYITTVGNEPALPKTLLTLYSDGLYKENTVTWSLIPEDKYGREGIFIVAGRVAGLEKPVYATVYVVAGNEMNLAKIATPTAIVDTPHDLGGVTTMNDGFEPTSSGDAFSHGAWHNWLGGNQGGDAWVQYTWNSEMILTQSAAYYFKDGGGNFNPSGVVYEYLDSNGAWQKFSNVTGEGVELDKYNITTFSPVITKSIRMTMTPAKLGCGVIEWKVYGYHKPVQNEQDKLGAYIEALKEIVYGLDQSKYTKESWKVLQKYIKSADELLGSGVATDEQVNEAKERIERAINSLVIKGTKPTTPSKPTKPGKPLETPAPAIDKVSELLVNKVTKKDKGVLIDAYISEKDIQNIKKDNTDENLTLSLPVKEIEKQFSTDDIMEVKIDLTIPSYVINKIQSGAVRLIIPKKSLMAARKANGNLLVSINNEDNVLISRWRINGSLISKSDSELTDFNLYSKTYKVNESAKSVAGTLLKKDKKNTGGVIIEFQQNKNFACVSKIYLKTQAKPGRIVYVYGIHEKPGKYVKLSNKAYKVNKKGYITIHSPYGGNYIIVRNQPASIEVMKRE